MSFTVITNASNPVVVVNDPVNNTVSPAILSPGNGTYTGTYQLDKAVILGNYTVVAYVNENGAYNTTTANFTVAMGVSADTGMSIQYAAYDPAQKAIVLRADVNSSSSDTTTVVKNDPKVKGMSVKGVNVLASTDIDNGSKPQAIKNEDKKVEVVIPLDNNNVDAVTRQYNLSKDITKATTSVAVNAAGTDIRLSLNDKVEGSWYRLSASIPAGYSVQKIVRADGTEITNEVQADRTTGEYVKNDINWYVDNGTLYFYDDPINGYDITLQPPMAISSLAVNPIYSGQLSAIVFPFNQTDTNAIITSNDHLCRNGDNGYGSNNDSDAGTKTSIRMFSTQGAKNAIIFGNDGETTNLYRWGAPYPTYNGGYTYSNHSTTGTANQYINGSQQIIGFNTVPDGSVESVVLTNFSTPVVTGAPSYVNITQKTIIRNNNLWFATVYYITNNGAANISNIRFTQGSDFNFNGKCAADDDFYSTLNDSVFGFKDSTDPNAIHIGGYRSPLTSSAHDVDEYYQIWYEMQTDTLNNVTSTKGMYGQTSIDGGMAMAWDNASLIKGQTWAVPVIWAVGVNNSTFFNTLNYSVNHNVYDVGIQGITTPVNGDNLDNQVTPVVQINATAMDLGVTDQSPAVTLQIKNSTTGAVVYTASSSVSMSVPYRETAPVSFNWNISGVSPGTYNVSVFTQLPGDQNTSNDLKNITVYVRDFSLYPDQWVHANPGDNVLYSLNLSNMGSQRTFDLGISPSTVGWASNLYYSNTSILLANDTTGDGTWDWVNASYKDPVSGLPAISIPASGKATLLLQKLVPAAADTGILDTVTLMAYPSGQPLVNSSAILRTDTPLAAMANKTFYLHSLNLNTTPETATTGSKAVTAIFAMWSQLPAFADNFMIAGNVSVPIYYTTTAAMPITVTLFYTNGYAGTYLIGSNTSTVPASPSQAVASMYNFTLAQAGNTTVPRGSYLVLKIDNQQTTAFNVWYTNTNRSRIEVKTPTYVHVGAINTYKGGTPAISFLPGDPVYVTANVTDPIGAYDIVGGTISVSAPNGSYIITNQSMALNRTDTGTPALWKLYNYSFTLGASLPAGVYGINITGYESNGVINRKNLSITVISSVPALSIYPNVTTFGIPGSYVDIKHAVVNLNAYRSDVPDIFVTTSPGWTVSLYQANGITLLTDTDSDGTPDAGSLAPLASTDIIIRVTVPSSANEGDVDHINVTARSSQNTSISSIASDIISIPNSAISIYPNATSLGAPNTVVNFSHTVTNLNVFRNDTIGISNISTQGWPIKLYKADGITPLTDTNGDGIIDVGQLGPSNSTNIVVSVTVPSYVNPGAVDIVTLTGTSKLNSSVTSIVSDTVFISGSSVVKTLYLHESSTGGFLNTSSVNSTITQYNIAATTGTSTWNQTPVFARDYNIIDDPGMTLYVVSPDGDVKITVTLLSNDGTVNKTLGSSTISTTIPANTLTPVNFDISLSAGYNITIPKGSKLLLKIDNTNNQLLSVYQSSGYPSHFDMDTSSYIDIQSLSLYDQTGNAITSVTPPSTVKVVANVTDPFGSFDISDVSLSLYYDNGTRAMGPINMVLNTTDTSTPSLWKLFDGSIALNTSFDTGNYNIIVIANESNSVKDNMSAPLAITYPVYVHASKSIASTGGNNFTVTLKVTNLDTHTVNGVHVYDFYSAYYTVGGFSIARTTVPFSLGALSGTINVLGPMTLAPGETKNITYSVQGTGDYHLSDMYLVGVDPDV